MINWTNRNLKLENDLYCNSHTCTAFALLNMSGMELRKQFDRRTFALAIFYLWFCFIKGMSSFRFKSYMDMFQLYDMYSRSHSQKLNRLSEFMKVMDFTSLSSSYIKSSCWFHQVASSLKMKLQRCKLILAN